jgi:hypothetical protein
VSLSSISVWRLSHYRKAFLFFFFYFILFSVFHLPRATVYSSIVIVRSSVRFAPSPKAIIFGFPLTTHVDWSSSLSFVFVFIVNIFTKRPSHGRHFRFESPKPGETTTTVLFWRGIVWGTPTSKGL